MLNASAQTIYMSVKVGGFVGLSPKAFKPTKETIVCLSIVTVILYHETSSKTKSVIKQMFILRSDVPLHPVFINPPLFTF